MPSATANENNSNHVLVDQNSIASYDDQQEDEIADQHITMNSNPNEDSKNMFGHFMGNSVVVQTHGSEINETDQIYEVITASGTSTTMAVIENIHTLPRDELDNEWVIIAGRYLIFLHHLIK